MNNIKKFHSVEKGIKKASELIDKDMLTNQERTLMKEYEGRKVVLRNEREEGEFKKSEQVIINGNKEGLSNLVLFKITGLSIKQIEEILKNAQLQENKE